MQKQHPFRHPTGVRVEGRFTWCRTLQPDAHPLPRGAVHNTTECTKTDWFKKKKGGGGGRRTQQPLRCLPETLQNRVDVLKGFINFCSDFSTYEDKWSRKESEMAFLNHKSTILSISSKTDAGIKTLTMESLVKIIFLFLKWYFLNLAFKKKLPKQQHR